MSHDPADSSSPDEEGSDEDEDSDHTTQRNRPFSTPYWTKQMNLSFQAKYSQVIDDLARMTGSMEPEREVRPESLKQKPGVNKVPKTQAGDNTQKGRT